MRAPRNVARPPVRVMKQTSWLSGLSAVRSPSSAARSRTCALVRWPTGNSVRASCALVEHVHDVALVLRRVGAAGDTAHTADLDDPGVVAGGDGVEAEQVGALGEPGELEVAVALDARVRRDAGAVGVDVRRDDVLGRSRRRS